MSLQGHLLRDVLFPIGGYTKEEIKIIAAKSDRLKGLAIHTKPESMGVCFIGKRSLPGLQNWPSVL